MALQDEIDRARAEIRTDSYAISIGEWMSLYERGELDIHPEFQRFFRWSSAQKSRLIESIILGIPIPPIFVAQRPDGIWDVVDGLQRLSTIFQLAEILKDESGASVPPLLLEATKYLPSLAGRRWESDDPDSSLSSPQRLLIKRSKIDVSIILKESDEKAKYELFQRLNTGGSPLSDQEVRNSLLVMINRDLYRWLYELSTDTSFQSTVALTDRALEEKYDMELVLRFIVLRSMSESELSKVGDMGEFLTDQAIALAEGTREIDREQEARAFRATFSLLESTLEDDSFRRFDWKKEKFVGGFSVSAFEAVALGLGYNFEDADSAPETIAPKVREIWRDKEFIDNSGSGIRASSRVPKIVPYARRLFAQ